MMGRIGEYGCNAPRRPGDVMKAAGGGRIGATAPAVGVSVL